MRCCRCVGSACSRCSSMHSACLLPWMLTSAHQPLARERVGTPVWAWQSMRGQAWTCVGMRGPTLGLQRTCDVACLHSSEGLGCAKHRPLSQLVGDLCACITDASFSSGARRWSMRMGTRRRHTLICVLISLSTGSARSLQAGERLDERLHRVHQPRSPVGHLLMISWHYIVAHRRMWPGEGKTLKPRTTRSCALESTSCPATVAIGCGQLPELQTS